MFHAIAAGVAGVALAAGSVLSPVPVTELGYQPTEASGGWFKIDDTARPFDVKFDADSVIFTGTGSLEMEAWRALDDKDLVFTLDKLDGVDIDGDGAYVKFPYAYVEGDIAGKKVDGPTSLVYEPEAITSQQVILTFWATDNPEKRQVKVSVDQFLTAVTAVEGKDPDLKGILGGTIAAGRGPPRRRPRWQGR